jgi:predicted nucleic acid-binding protein
VHAVDTNVLVRLVTRDDARQAAAAERFVVVGAWVPLLALAEASWVLASVYELEAGAIADAMEMLSDHVHLTLEQPGVVTAAIALFRRRPRLGFSDCLMLEAARAAGHLPLGTFDRGLGRADGAQKLA